MQNKPNLKIGKIALTPCHEKHYRDFSPHRTRKNKPNQTQSSMHNEILSNVVDEIFFRLKGGTTPRAVLIFSSTQPPKPDLAFTIWLRLGGDDIRTASPKAMPFVPLLSILSR
jgi:hypothetical protein